MKSNINILPLRTWSAIPPKWEARPNMVNYDKATEFHQVDGWGNVIIPPYDPATQRLGSLIRVSQSNNDVTYEVIELTTEELQARNQAQAESDRSAMIAKEQEKAIMDSYQAIEDEGELLENQSIYPIWETLEDGVDIELNKKYQSFEGTELRLFKCIQAHAKQSDYVPILVPALFSQIIISNGIEVWTQPIGGDGKYVFGSIVFHNGFNWENTHPAPNLNVWEPGVFGWVQI